MIKKSKQVKISLPGYGNFAANLLARTWNESIELQNATNLYAAKSAARKWSKDLKFNA